MSEYSGGCACGAVRYSANAEPLNALHCHCRQCQHATGTGHSSLFVMPKEAVAISGELRFFDQRADDGSTVSRGFCPLCGSPVLGFTSGKPDILLIAAASLDNPALFHPKRIVFAQNAHAWDYMDPALPKN